MKLNNKNILIFFSFFIFFISALHSNFGYLKSKDYPNGYDNHFAYLIKSTNLKYCFFKYSCKGLQSIENQILEKKENNSYNHQIGKIQCSNI